MPRPVLDRIHPRHPTIFAALIVASLALGVGSFSGAAVALATNPLPPVPALRHRTRTATGRARSAGRCRVGRAKPPSCRRSHAARRHLVARPIAATPKRTRRAVVPPPAVPSPSPAAVIASVLAAPCPNTEVVPEAGNIGTVRTAVLCLINRERAQHGEAPLTISPDLERAAEEHDQELIADDYFAHVSPSGVTPVDRISATGYIPSPEVGYVIGENLAWGTLDLSTPSSIVAAWIASPGHLANILESQYTETGIGIVATVPSSLSEGEQGATYAQEFGVIIR